MLGYVITICMTIKIYALKIVGHLLGLRCMINAGGKRRWEIQVSGCK